MSRRTIEANKAILAAWNREQKLVKDGKGTREWTLVQQQDILNRGKAYDEDGVAFQGQHMKSAEKYPEFQGDPDNIQFLTRAEHLEAHGGNWRNPTNWYYDPITKNKIDFGDGPFVPCEIIKLKEPVYNVGIESSDEKDVIQDSTNDVEDNTKCDSFSETVPQKNSIQINKDDTETKKGVFYKVKSGLKKARRYVVSYPSKHPKVVSSVKKVGKVAKYVGTVATAATVVAVEVAKNSSSGSTNGSSGDKTNHNHNGINDSSDSYKRDDLIMETSEREYTPNDVPAGKQRYHYKDGSVKWKEKKPYHRGGKEDE